MEAKNDNPRVVRHITLSAEEDATLRQRAEQAGMGTNAYIRNQLLEDRTGEIDWSIIRQHTRTLDYIAQEVRVYTSNENPDCWLFAADLDQLERLLKDIKEQQEKLIQAVSQ